MQNLGVQKNDRIPEIALQENKYLGLYLIAKLFLLFFLQLFRVKYS